MRKLSILAACMGFMMQFQPIVTNAAPKKSSPAHKRALAPWPTVNAATPPDDDGQNPIVSAVQYLLKAHGFYKGKVDGIYGAKTIAAVKTFEKAKKLKVDGVAGPQTLSALVIQVQRGSQSDAVRAVQILMRASYEHVEGERRNAKIAIDGIFGSDTEKTVIWAQSDFNLEKEQLKEQLKEDGIVGLKTWRLFLWDATPIKTTPKR